MHSNSYLGKITIIIIITKCIKPVIKLNCCVFVCGTCNEEEKIVTVPCVNLVSCNNVTSAHLTFSWRCEKKLQWLQKKPTKVSAIAPYILQSTTIMRIVVEDVFLEAR